MSDQLPEVWLRGPVPEIPELLQPVAHALLQAGEEVDSILAGFPNELLWTRPGGVASVGFHLQHLRGVVDRLFTYARDSSLDPQQLVYLDAEGAAPEPSPTVAELVSRFHDQVHLALGELAKVDVSALTESRPVGRSGLPSTRLGLYVHVAEHTMRHVGQLLVTVRVQQPTGTNQEGDQ